MASWPSGSSSPLVVVVKQHLLASSFARLLPLSGRELARLTIGWAVGSPEGCCFLELHDSWFGPSGRSLLSREVSFSVWTQGPWGSNRPGLQPLTLPWARTALRADRVCETSSWLAHGRISKVPGLGCLPCALHAQPPPVSPEAPGPLSGGGTRGGRGEAAAAWFPRMKGSQRSQDTDWPRGPLRPFSHFGLPVNSSFPFHR